jgi:hypothetical protein
VATVATTLPLEALLLQAADMVVVCPLVVTVVVEAVAVAALVTLQAAQPHKAPMVLLALLTTRVAPLTLVVLAAALVDRALQEQTFKTLLTKDEAVTVLLG